MVEAERIEPIFGSEPDDRGGPFVAMRFVIEAKTRDVPSDDTLACGEHSEEQGASDGSHRHPHVRQERRWSVVPAQSIGHHDSFGILHRSPVGGQVDDGYR